MFFTLAIARIMPDITIVIVRKCLIEDLFTSVFDLKQWYWLDG